MVSIMIDPVSSPYLVPFDSSWRVDRAATAPPEDKPKKKACKARLRRSIASG